MSTKFAFRAGIHISGLLIILLIVSLAIGVNFFEKSNFDIIILICILLIILGHINNFFTHYIVSEKGLELKSIIKRTNIQWNEIECIMEQPAGKFVTLSIGVFSSTKRISITPWTKDYKNLLQLVIEKCKTNEKIKVDPRICDIIK